MKTLTPTLSTLSRQASTKAAHVMPLLRRRSRMTLVALACFLILLYHLVPSRNTSGFVRPYFSRSSVRWYSYRQFHPTGTSSLKKLPTLPKGATPVTIPLVQANASEFDNPDEPDPRRKAVVHAFKRSWAAYSKYAWLADELAPVRGHGRETLGGWAVTLIDSLDTLWIMGMEAEFWEATAAITGMDFSTTDRYGVDMFETNIRHLGGLIAAYDLTGNWAILQKATEVADMLYVGFDTPNRLPGCWLVFEDSESGDQLPGKDDPSACAAAFTLEFTRLSQITEDPKYYAAADRITRLFRKTQGESLLPGIWPETMDMRKEEASAGVFSLGAKADGLYEYLPKLHALLGGLDPVYEEMYRDAMKVVADHLLFRPMLPGKEDILFSGEARVGPATNISGVEHVAKTQHQACFAGGMFGLGSKLFNVEEHLELGEKLTHGCSWAYGQFASGLMAEAFTLFSCGSTDECEWDEQRWLAGKKDKRLGRGLKEVQDTRNLLRPEAIESIFVMYRLTGNEEYREIAWDMFQDILMSAKTEFAFSTIKDVRAAHGTEKANSMEVSFLFLTSHD